MTSSRSRCDAEPIDGVAALPRPRGARATWHADRRRVLRRLPSSTRVAV